MDENVLALGGRDGRNPKNGPCIGENDNPMLINVVLTVLFEYVKGKDLKPCRLVCNRWNHVSLPFVRDQFKVTIFGPDHPTSRGTRDFAELIGSNTLGIPFGRFSLPVFDISEEFGQQFLQTCGISAKEIIFNLDFQQSIDNIGKILKSVPKLESFMIPEKYSISKDGRSVQPKLFALKCLKVVGTYPKEENICQTYFDEIFQAAQNISSIELSCGRFNVSLEVLETIEKLGRESMILNLKICYLNEKHLEILRRMSLKANGLKLKKLDLPGRGHGDINFGVELVGIFKDSLISLRLTSYRCRQWITFPRMSKMKVLHLISYGLSPLNCKNFMNIFPSLEKLYCDYTLSFYPYCAPWPRPTYKYKSSILRCAQIKMENLNAILTIFPTLKFLECEVDKADGVEVIKKIWAHMTQLEGLIVSGTLQTSENMDSLVTGIPVLYHKRMKEFCHSLPELEMSNRELKIESQRAMMTKNSELPSIRNLTSLRYLTLRLIGTDGRISTQKKYYLTDVTAYFGLYALNNLRHFKISPCKFSKSCSEMLVKDKNLINWEFRSPSNEEIVPIAWNRKTVPEYAEDF